jgi:hypothetical protein
MSDTSFDDRFQDLEKRIRRMQTVGICMFSVILILISLFGISLSYLGTAHSKMSTALNLALEAQIQSSQDQSAD